MQIRIGGCTWQEVVLLDPPSRTVTLEQGTVWHIAPNRSELLELDLFMTPILEKHAPWELKGRKSLVLTEGQEILEYEIRTEPGDQGRYEMFYFYKFTAREADYFQFPVSLLRGACVQVESAALRYFLADTLFFDYLISPATSEESRAEVIRNLEFMKREWKRAQHPAPPTPS